MFCPSAAPASGLLTHFFHQLEAVASPGPLSDVHRSLDQPEGCQRCHDDLKGLSNDLCLDCHTPVAQRIRDHSGRHGTFDKSCYICHKEHQGRAQGMIDLASPPLDHDQTLFPLTGRHTALACEACHASPAAVKGSARPRAWIGLPRQCAGCHARVHGNAADRAGASAAAVFNQDCSACHTTGGWRPATLKFEHQKTAFPLRGRHAQADCAQCHKGMKVFKGTPMNCDACHAASSPHQGQFAGRACAQCHTESGWKGPALKFNHQAMTAFPLRGRHARLDCSACHAGGKFRGTSPDCAACHKTPHRDQFAGRACLNCHSFQGWKGANLRFNHAAGVRFPLTGRHAALPCAQCHKGGQYRATPTDCAACHAASSPHQGRIKRDCSACHTTAGFGARTLKFNHDQQTRFALTGPHSRVDCSRCHADRTFRAAGLDCADCHGEVEKFYAGTLFPDRLAPAPDAMYGQVDCEACHQATDARADSALIQARCVRCHNAQYGDLLAESRGVIAGEIKKLPPDVAGKPANQPLLKTIGRLAPHNFNYADKLLNALGRPVVKPAPAGQ